MSGFITFVIVVGLIIWGEAKKNQRRDEQYRKEHPNMENPTMKQTTATKSTMKQTTSTTKRTVERPMHKVYKNPVTQEKPTERATSTNSGATTADENTIYQQMRQTSANTAAKKEADAQEYAENRIQREEDAYRAEARSISTKIDSSKLIEEVYDIMACGYHPETIKQRDFVGEGLEILNQYN